MQSINSAVNQPNVPTAIKRFLRCDPEHNPVFDNEIISVPKNSVDFAVKLFDRLATIEGKFCAGCGDAVAIATVPEWYQIRLEGKVPQLILTYKQIKADGTLGKDHYPITVPHPQSTAKPSTKLTNNYPKGNWQILLTLADNSKVLINAETERDGIKIMKEIKGLINPDYLENSTLKTAHYPDSNFKEFRVTNVRADYYPNGMRNMRPEWSARLQ